MSVRFVRPISHSAYTARRLGFSALALFVIAALAHRFGPLSTPDFLALLFLSAAIAAVSVPLSLIGLMRLWQVGASGGVAATKGLIYAAVPLAVVATGAFYYYTLPPLHDISTDIVDPPPWVAEPKAGQKWLPRPPPPPPPIGGSSSQPIPASPAGVTRVPSTASIRVCRRRRSPPGSRSRRRKASS